MGGSWDAVVVGGGLAGMACARGMARAGKRVALVERSFHLGGQALGLRRGGQLWPLTPEAPPEDGPAALALRRELGLPARGPSARSASQVLLPGGAVADGAALAAVAGVDDGPGADPRSAASALGPGALLTAVEGFCRARLRRGAEDVSASWVRWHLRAPGRGPDHIEDAPLASRLAEELTGVDLRLGTRAVALLMDGAGAARGVGLESGELLEAPVVVAAVAAPVLGQLLGAAAGAEPASRVSALVCLADGPTLPPGGVRNLDPALAFDAAAWVGETAEGRVYALSTAVAEGAASVLLALPPRELASRLAAELAGRLGGGAEVAWWHLARVGWAVPFQRGGEAQDLPRGVVRVGASWPSPGRSGEGDAVAAGVDAARAALALLA